MPKIWCNFASLNLSGQAKLSQASLVSYAMHFFQGCSKGMGKRVPHGREVSQLQWFGNLVLTIEVDMLTDFVVRSSQAKSGKSMRNASERDTWNLLVRCIIWKYHAIPSSKRPLFFSGAKTWWYFASSGKKAWNPDNWETHPVVKTNVGTNPEGSEWMMITLPTELVSKEKWAIKDLVEVRFWPQMWNTKVLINISQDTFCQVPESLEPGRYVLSFRWDCQQSPQVWNSCANIDIVWN